MNRVSVNTLLILVFTCFSVLGDRVVLKTVGQVGAEVITSRSVQIHSAVEQALFIKDKKLIVPAIDSAAFKKETTGLLLEIVVFLESQNFNNVKISTKEVRQAIEAAEKVARKSTDWKRLQVTKVELKTFVKRKLRAKKFIRFKADSSVVPITQSEAKDYFEKNRLKFGDLPFDNFQENIKAFLTRQQVEQRLRDWFEVLQNKYKVQNYLSGI